MPDEREKGKMSADELLQQFLKDVSDDMECTDKCDSYGHDEECPVTNTAVAWRRLRERNAAFVSRAAALEAEVARLRKAMEKVSAACPKYDPKKWRDDYCDCEDRHDTMLGDIGDDVRQALQGAVE